MSKAVVAIHGPDHGMGGPDPYRPELPFIHAHDGATGQTVTATAELTFRAAKTNDPYEDGGGTFGLDPDDPEGVLIYRPGLYQVLADVSYAGASLGVSRSIYTGWSRLSNGPLAALGNELRPGIGAGQGASGISEVTTIAKGRLSHYALTTLDVSGLDSLTIDPYRVVVILQHNGANHTVGNGSDTSNLIVVRVAGLGESIDFTP